MESSNDANADTGKNLKVPIIVLAVLVALTGLIDFGFGVALQFAPEIFAAEFGAEFVPELKGLISVFGISTLFWGLATLVSARWIWKRKLAGLIIGVLSGAKLLFASLATFASNGEVSVLFFDGLRGATIVGLAVVLAKTQKNFIQNAEV